jgi:hypothetical protein
VVFKDYNGWSTGLQVQNLGSTPTTVEIVYTGTTGGAWSERAEVPAMGSHSFYQPSNSDLPRGFAGSAMVRSRNGQPIVVAINAVRDDGAAMAYSALPNVGPGGLEVPLVFGRQKGWDVGVRLFNSGEAPARATVIYQGAQNQWTEPVTVDVGSFATLFQSGNRLSPAPHLGAAKVVGSSGMRLVGIANEVSAGAPAAASYAVGQVSAVPLLAMPLVMKDADGMSTAIHVQNPNRTPVALALVFYDLDGNLTHRIEQTLAAGASHSYEPSNVGAIPAGFTGSAMLHSQDGQPLLAVVSVTSQ